ncbi:amidohydrolase family protein [Desulfobulbus alkaliphilus]|uniref:amidohydrolase family protein n=1 Tax=Desulfobulbus alkaliphilus TaxID=869814 RepID=UPI0019659BAC|nr:amidohydrolase family protein [Desulfobulbus alkaliphilus]MBM9538416.1 amidohydrolase family protein [Desulfobulbus alkaliphilus]
MTPVPTCIHAAPWVVPVCSPIIAEGGVAVGDGRIVAVDVLPRLQQLYPQAEVRMYPGSILTPALVNGHTHLELSHLAALTATAMTDRFTDWISRLLQLREILGADGEPAWQAARLVADRQYQSGVSALCDIGNTSMGGRLADLFPGYLLACKEYLGLAAWTLEKNLTRLGLEPPQVRCCGHAPYSTHPRLLQRLKERARALEHVFSIHTAEPAAEADMIREGRGELVDFIRQRGFWDNSFVSGQSDGSIHYLYDLGLLDEQTLCVHAIHVTEEEMRIMAGEGSKVCLCSGSNRFLGVGTAPVARYLDHGILPALGTDSLASNPELSLWREMSILAEDHPEIEAAEIFAMATLGGAEALGLGRVLGTLEAGKAADLLIVPSPPSPVDPKGIMTHLVTAGPAMSPDRIAFRG